MNAEGVGVLSAVCTRAAQASLLNHLPFLRGIFNISFLKVMFDGDCRRKFWFLSRNRVRGRIAAWLAR